MKALSLYAGPAARRHIEKNGLRPEDVRMIPAAAGGPKGLILQPLDQHLFGQWLPQSDHEVHLIGASIGAWRMATALLPDPTQAFELFATGYIEQHYEPEPGRKLPSPERVSEGFAQNIRGMFGPHLDEMLRHPRYRLHVITSRGRQILRRAGRWQTALGMSGLALGNAMSRKSVGLFLERTVFSSPGSRLPFDLRDQPTRHVTLTAENFGPAVQASCTIPFWLSPVMDIPGAVPGAHWDGGLVDYHIHWNYSAMKSGLVLYPHFQKQVVPGWLDKSLKWRHKATPALDNMLVLAPNPDWVKRLPGGKLPDRNDFTGMDVHTRIKTWRGAVAQAQALADEWAEWLANGTPLSDLKSL
ncbi:MAG: phospholipase [Aquabacterium sp.]